MSNVFYEICFIDEILAGSYASSTSQLVRVLGKLKSYNPISCVGRLADPECKSVESLVVNLQHIESVSFVKDSVYQVLGEIKDISGEKILHASIVINVEAIDVQMFKKAIFLRRKFLSRS